MTDNFKEYSQYYDVLYQHKNYQAESRYVSNHIRQHLPGASKLLELGCGTGSHAQYLCSDGYEITGMDRSAGMIDLAKNKGIENFHPLVDDITTFNLNQRFDAVISMFHVMCYLTANEDLMVCFNKVSEHLEPGGVFVFDMWYGPAVLNDLPSTRIKRKQTNKGEILCLVETQMHFERNVADVHYDFIIMDNEDKQFHRFNEKHPVRYFSIPEIQSFAEQSGFKLLSCEKFMSAEKPDISTRDVLIVLQKTI